MLQGLMMHLQLSVGVSLQQQRRDDNFYSKQANKPLKSLETSRNQTPMIKLQLVFALACTGEHEINVRFARGDRREQL